MMTAVAPFPLPDALHLARERYGLAATATRLPGEYDANFRLDTPEGQTFLLRISHPEASSDLLAFQQALLAYLAATPVSTLVPQLLPDADGRLAGTCWEPSTQALRQVRLFTWVPGRMLVHVRPHTPELLHSVGQLLGQVDTASQGFTHPASRRRLKWDLGAAGWIEAHLDALPDPARRALVQRLLRVYAEDVQPRLAGLRRSVIHNDANDYNVLVDGVGYAARASGLIDFGDALEAPTVCNLAITLAYLMLGKLDPLAAAHPVVQGYHAAFPLTEDEVALLWPLARMRLCVSVVNSALRQLEDDDPYLRVSEAPAWHLLEQMEACHPRLAHYQLRQACGLEPVPQAPAVRAWLDAHRAAFAAVTTPDLRQVPARTLDLSPGSLDLGLPDETDTTAHLTRTLDALLDGQPGLGRYNEPRLLYTSDDFMTPGEEGPEPRTVHLGLDVFLPPGTPVQAPLNGVVHSLGNHPARLDYGPCIVLEHMVEEDAGLPLRFWTLYGHLTPASLDAVQVGQTVHRGQPFAWIGSPPENGDWPPHLHFQVITDLLDHEGTFPGVARPCDRALWQSLSPDPNLVLGLDAARTTCPDPDPQALLARRKARIGYNLSLSYRQPLHLVRGRGAHLFDEAGRAYLDLYNNVPHVGHAHPKVVRAAQRQMAVLNTNTRYLHEALLRYAERLTATFPDPLKVCFFVASGSEATELSLRLARAWTGQRDLIVSDGAYHGHTTTLVEISPYKAEGPGGMGLPDWVHKARLPDVYRGPYRGADAGQRYAAEVQDLIAGIQAQGRGLCGLLLESIPSVGGQIVLPPGYLPEVYRHVRAAGGVCMADEVQTGFGRIGTHWWAFQHYGVTPDVVALGKPIGNGYPMGAVITTPEIAARFDNGMEFFSTFGGSTVACTVGEAVLEVVQSENLLAQAHDVGTYLLARLRLLMDRHAVVGDVRGLGLMLGLELVTDRTTRTPAPEQARYVADRLKDHGILLGTDGLDHNVLKIRGPMCLTRADADRLVGALDAVLAEEAAQTTS